MPEEKKAEINVGYTSCVCPNSRIVTLKAAVHPMPK